jgi:predicted regulator of Ras-like GTPase activity (Roadblock/LC7/MglB family)
VACRAFEQSELAMDMVGRGGLERLILVGSEGNMIITRAGGDALCVALLRPEAKLGTASYQAVHISQQIEDVLD